jgi:hypothetical protein
MIAPIPIKLVTEYLKLPFIISETNPLKSVISGENAPRRAPTVLREFSTPPVAGPPENAALTVAAKSGNTNRRSVGISSKNDRILNVRAPAARFFVVSPIV